MGGVEEIEKNENKISLISLSVTKPTTEPYSVKKKEWKKMGIETRNDLRKRQHRAHGGLVPTERAQWVAESEACWIYKQSIYPARDPERLALANVIYINTRPSFTLCCGNPLSPFPLSLWIVSVRGPWCPVSPQLWYLIIVTTDSVTSISFPFRYIIYKAAGSLDV